MIYHAGYAGVQAPSARERVADAWRAGHAARGSNYATDGKSITSYGWHVVAVTLPDGTKAAFDCHYSPTTTKQTGPAKVAADVVIPCASCAVEHGKRPTLVTPGLPDVLVLAIESVKFANCDKHKQCWTVNAPERTHYGRDLYQGVCPIGTTSANEVGMTRQERAAACRIDYGYVAAYDNG